jgi:hypothetical protein
MKKKYLNKNGELDAKKIAKSVENVYKEYCKLTTDKDFDVNKSPEVNRQSMLIYMKLIDLFQDLYEQPDEEDMTDLELELSTNNL